MYQLQYQNKNIQTDIEGCIGLRLTLFTPSLFFQDSFFRILRWTGKLNF